MGSVLTRLSPPSSPAAQEAEWEDTHDYASTIRQPVSLPVSVSEEIIEATEKGMMGENLLFAGDWPLRNDDTPPNEYAQQDAHPEHCGRTQQVEHPRHENESGGSVLTRAEEACRGSSCVGRVVSRDGIGTDGCRHVRWKGVDV